MGSQKGSDKGSGKKTKKKMKKSDMIMKQFNSKMGMAHASIPKAMLEGQFLRLNQWSSIIDDEALHHLAFRNVQRIEESTSFRRQVMEDAKAKGLDAMTTTAPQRGNQRALDDERKERSTQRKGGLSITQA